MRTEELGIVVYDKKIGPAEGRTWKVSGLLIYKGSVYFMLPMYLRVLTSWPV